MIKRKMRLIAVVGLVFVLVFGLAAAPVAAQPPEMVKVLIGFTDKSGPAEEEMVRGAGGKIKYSYNLVPAIAATVPEAAIEGLRANPNVTYVELDGRVYIIGQTLPWGVDRIDAEVVHGYNKGTGVKVAILDTGIDYNHEDLDANYKGGYDFVNTDTDPMDDRGHGTHVAGTVAALDNDIGVIGVAPEAELYALKVLDETGGGYWSDVIAAIQWSVTNEMQVINMSFGGTGDSESLHTACDAAYTSGVLLVSSAGNSGNPPGRGDNITYPAKYSSVIAVAATDKDDTRARWSSTGADLELAAPGVAINSTLLDVDGGYGEKSGTSMASPHVAGVAALVIASGITDANADGFINDDVRLRLQETAEDLGDAGWDAKYGYGLVDADEAAMPADTTPPAKVTGLAVTTVSCAQLDLAWGANTEEDLHHYNVYRSTTSGDPYDLIASPTANSYSDTGLTASTIYYYMVSAVDTSGNEGEASAKAFGTTSVDDLGPLTLDMVADANPTNGATSVTLTAKVDDSTTGNSNVVAAEYFLDAIGADGSGTPMSASDGTFDSPTEAVTAAIDVSGWAVGQYTLYVHGQDAAGNWGATESVVLDVTEAPSTIMYVESITFSSKVAGPNKFLYTTVKVVDSSGNPLSGVRVEMTLDWDKEGDGVVNGSWNFAGDTKNSTSEVEFTLLKAPSGYYMATVTNLILTDYTWDTVKGVTSANCELKDDGTVIQ